VSLFVALDGPDGCGKSTQARRLVEALRAQGRTVLHLREPGSTPFGERLRAALLDPAVGELAPLTEALAFFAARRAMLDEEVGPALARGDVVIAERSFLSTIVYQGSAFRGRGVEDALLRGVTEAVHAACRHDLVIVLDVDPEVAARRAADRDPDRIEARGLEFQKRVREGFVALSDPGHWAHGLATAGLLRVDSNRGFDEVHGEILRAVTAGLERGAPGRAEGG
jgi:dTMP kinase